MYVLYRESQTELSFVAGFAHNVLHLEMNYLVKNSLIKVIVY